jgi:glycosyltransferase involved in cell wall biosynthesis
MSKRCLIVAYYFPPLGGGGVQRVTKFIKYLSRLDWEFTVITSKPESVYNTQSDESLLAEIPDTTEIIRIPNPYNTSPNTIKSKLISFLKSNYFTRWIISFFFFPDLYRRWTRVAKDQIHEQLNQKEYHVVMVSSPPYSLACLAADLTEEIKLPVVLDMRDPWTTNPYKIHPTFFHYGIDKRIEFKTISKIKYGISAYKTLIDFYCENIPGFNANSWITIPNGFDEEDFFSLKTESQNNHYLNIAFSGTFYSHLNNPELFLKAISKLRAAHQQRIKFHHIGSSVISIKQMAEKMGLQGCVHEWGYKSHKECLEILSGMDVLCFILDSAVKNSAFTIGGKVYEYLRLKKPILALIPQNGEAASIIKETNSGVIIDPHNTDKITATLKKWIDKMPEFKSHNLKKYEREVGAKELNSYILKIQKS